MTLIAINILLDSDPATLERAQATIARLRRDYPDGFALAANNTPHTPCSSSLCARQLACMS